MTSLFFSNVWRKRIATFFIAGFLIAAVPRPAYAWGDYMGNAFGSFMDYMFATIDGLLRGIVKKIAVELAVRTANKVTGNGNKNSPSFITDYKRYIYDIALNESLVFADNFLTETLGGKVSGLVYTAASGGLQSLGRNYMNYLAGEARNELNKGYCQYSLDQFSNDPIKDLGLGNWRVLNAIVANPCNNPAGYTNQVKQAFQQDLQRRAELARTKAIASQGFIGTEKNGQVTAPGVILKDLISKAQGTAFDLITQATGWSEILAAAAGAFSNQVITNLFQNGFESVAKKVDRELGKVDKSVMDARRDIERQLGPGANYFRNINQQTNGGNNNWNIPGGKTQTGIITWPTTPNCTVDQGC